MAHCGKAWEARQRCHRHFPHRPYNLVKSQPLLSPSLRQPFKNFSNRIQRQNCPLSFTCIYMPFTLYARSWWIQSVYTEASVCCSCWYIINIHYHEHMNLCMARTMCSVNRGVWIIEVWIIEVGRMQDILVLTLLWLLFTYSGCGTYTCIVKHSV